MTTKQPFFYAEFYLDRIQECYSICSFQAENNYPNEYRYHEMHRLFHCWLGHYENCIGFSSAKSEYFIRLFADLHERYLNHQLEQDIEDEFLDEVMDHNEKNQPVPEPAPPAQLSVFRVLGQASAEKYIPFYTLNEFEGYKQVASRFAPNWRPTLTLTKRLLSNTRPVGGLEQCQ